MPLNTEARFLLQFISLLNVCVVLVLFGSVMNSDVLAFQNTIEKNAYFER